MKTNFLTIILLISFVSCKNTNDIIEVKVSYVDLEVFTPISVGCNSFEEYFDKDIRTIVVSNSKAQEFHEQLNSLIKRGKQFNDTPDVRVKATITHKNGQYTVCISNNLVSHNGAVYVIDDSFRNFLVVLLQGK